MIITYLFPSRIWEYSSKYVPWPDAIRHFLDLCSFISASLRTTEWRGGPGWRVTQGFFISVIPETKSISVSSTAKG